MGRLTHRTGSGWTYFITTKAWQSAFLFQVEETAQIIVAKMLEYRDKGNYLLHDFVLMPNHLHLILTPAESVSLEKAMQLIKGGSSFEIHKVRGLKLQIWQSGFHESRVTSWTDYQEKRDYVHFNPVAAKLIDRPEFWPYGSASGKFGLDPIPQGLKPVLAQLKVGPKGPTPVAPTSVSTPEELKPLPPKASEKTEEMTSSVVQTSIDATRRSTPGTLSKKVGA
jgi:putative transposase